MGGHRKDALRWICQSPQATTEDPITEARIALVELLQRSGDGDFLRAVAEAVLQIPDGSRCRAADCGVECVPLWQSGRDDWEVFAVERADRRNRGETKCAAEN
jgi:hypothetical protein